MTDQQHDASLRRQLADQLRSNVQNGHQHGMGRDLVIGVRVGDQETIHDGSRTLVSC